MRTVALARSRPGWEVWETVGNTGKKGGALNQAWARLEPELTEHDYVVTMDADTMLDAALRRERAREVPRAAGQGPPARRRLRELHRAAARLARSARCR